MGRLYLRSFSVEESSRLAALINKAKNGVINPAEDRALVELINRAEAISRHNARQVRARRGDGPPSSPSKSRPRA